MEKCFSSCLGVILGRRYNRRATYLTRYEYDNPNIDLEFQSILTSTNSPSCGTTLITEEERQLLSKRQYDQIVEDYSKLDEPIENPMFEEYLVDEQSANLTKVDIPTSSKKVSPSPSPLTSKSNLTLEEMEDDFDDFLANVEKRSFNLQNQYSTSEEDAQGTLERTVSKQPQSKASSLKIDNNLTSEISTKREVDEEGIFSLFEDDDDEMGELVKGEAPHLQTLPISD